MYELQALNLEYIRNDQLLFTQLNFTLAPGNLLHIVGQNGSGKSTLLNILLGFLIPTEGEMRWQNHPISTQLHHYQAQLAYVGHKLGVKSGLTVAENVRLQAMLSGVDSLNWDEILSYFSLESLENRFCEHLSAGQQQRVALTRLLIQSAPIWILDEPFSALDEYHRQKLQALIALHVQRKGMVILTSHQPLVWTSLQPMMLQL
ncbi:MAG: cytochrome c biogenesis heme-transporting ATPase CcmA [Gammaproteobacteria bacterium]